MASTVGIEAVQGPSKRWHWLQTEGPDASEDATALASEAGDESETVDRAEPGRLLAVETWTPPAAPTLGDAFDVLQAFDGTIESISGDDVSVVLRDLTDPDAPDESAVMSAWQFDDPQRVVVGAPFYLTVGYRERRSGRELVTVARLRTIPPLTAAQRARAEQEAKALFGIIGQPAAEGDCDPPASNRGR